MFALTLAAILAATIPSPLHIAAGDTMVFDVETRYIYGATYYSEIPQVATVSGQLPPRAGGRVTVEAIAEGTTRMMASFVSGLSVHRIPVALIVVGTRPTVTVAASNGILTAMTTGSTPILVSFREGETLLGYGPSLKLPELAPGVHRIVASASNTFGTATTEIVITVEPPRRRSARH